MDKELSVSQYLNQDSIIVSIQQTLADKAPQFIASVSALAANNKALAACDKKSLMSACLIAATLDLPINPNLAFAYIIPYNNTRTQIAEAQFQMGWRGYIQLAQRTGLYETINPTDVREGEILSKDRLSGEYQFSWIEDEDEREKLPIVGYVAYFKLLNGFSKTLYMTTKKVEGHAKKYSQSYRSNSTKMNPWKDDFDGMAKKTVLKLLIGRFGPMTVEIQKALTADQSVDRDGKESYVDNQPTDSAQVAHDKEKERIRIHIELAQDLIELEMVEDHIGDYELTEMYDDKRKELGGK